MRKRILLASCLCVLAVTSCTIPDNKGQIWNIGVPDSSTVELALGPDRYKDFLANDFGFEDRYFLVGKSDVKKSPLCFARSGRSMGRDLVYRRFKDT